MAGFDPYDFFVLRPLRWAFGQTFGSKAKAWFDANIKATIATSIASGNLDYQGAIAQFISSPYLNKMVSDMEAKLGIPVRYRPVVAEYLQSLIQAEIDSLLKAKK